MWKPTLVVTVILLLVTTTAAGTLPATDSSLSNEAPLVDAGLDQEVSKGTTVLLDATGSNDPDGTIEEYHWSIRTPSNETISPDCSDCPRPEFTPSEVGRYHVTLTVTDDEGATKSDTLYVDVSPGTKPDISLSGPQQPTEGTVGTYTANLDAGTAGLEYVVWTIDGTEIANNTVSPDQDEDATTKRFPTAGERTITATVYDADGQSNTNSLLVAVQPEPVPPESSLPPQSPRSEDPLAAQTSPTVLGDTLLTGSKPLRGNYEIQLDTNTSNVVSVEWRITASSIANGHSLTRVWEPGDHDIYAVVTYDDGSENVATFSDGTTSVVADPQPNASFGALDRYGSISGSVTSSDEYGNLDTLRVEVDGQTIATSFSTVRGRNRLDNNRQRTVRFSHSDFTPGEPYSVTLVATDKRGQTTEISREIVPVKKPEIVTSEFVNSPVDSYHERLDSSRYAAHHVLKIDLNGVDSENVSVDVQAGDKVSAINDSYSGQRISDNGDNELLVETFWKGSNPGTYEVDGEYVVDEKSSTWWNEVTAQFKVTPSKPELRLEVLNDGTKDYITKEHGILVNASGSFDPDGTNLKYIWKYGANPTKPDNTTAKFRTYERAASIVEDQYELRTKRNFDFLSYFVPDVQEKTVLTEGPYFPNETVRIRVETSPYHFSKQTYYDDFGLRLSISNSQAEVLKWRQIEAPNSGHSDATEDAYRYVAIVEIPASELSQSSQTPTITAYNEDNERKTTGVDFPDVNVLLEDGTYWKNVTVPHLTYTVEKPNIREVTANTENQRDDYLENGYSVDTKRQETEYLLEQRVKVQDAQYGKRTKTFDSKWIRDSFLDGRSEWYRSGTVQKEVTRTETTTEWHDATTAKSKSEWHDSDLWNGEYTGESRRKVVEPAVYQTQHEYQYEYEVEKTGTKTVTRTRTVKVLHTGSRTVTKCTALFGCYETTETYTYYTTEEQTYTITREYTYTVTQTETYWAVWRYDMSHKSTGKARKVKIDDAVYELQYEIEQKSQYTETVTRYEVARDELAQPAQYEWKKDSSTTDLMLARQQAASGENWRIGTSTTDTTWTLTKQSGTVRFEVSQYVNESDVVKTSATVEGERIQRYYNLETDEKVTKPVGEQSNQYTSDSGKTIEEIIDEVTGSDDDDEECTIKRIC